MLIECIKCGVQLHTDSPLDEGRIEVTCTECGAEMKIDVSLVEGASVLDKATGIMEDVRKGMDIDKVISNYLGD